MPAKVMRFSLPALMPITIYLLTATGLTPGGSSTVHICTQTIHRTTQITTNLEECGPCPVFASFTLAFASQLRKKHGKTSVRVRRTSVRLRKPHSEYSIHITKTPTHYKTHTYTHIHTHRHTHTHTHTHTHITKQYKTTTVQIKTLPQRHTVKSRSERLFREIFMRFPHHTFLSVFPAYSIPQNSCEFATPVSLGR